MIEQQRRVAPALPHLSPRAEVALLARVLHRVGYADGLAGHITYRTPDDTLLVNPFGLTWDELTPADIMEIDFDGKVVAGPWTVTPAITLHLELHRTRHDVIVALHNHPRWGTLWADMGREPPAYDQTGGLVAGRIAVHQEYDGTVNERSSARTVVAALGDASMALLANHGVLVVAPSIAQAYHRANTLEWRCRQAWHIEAIGGGAPLHPTMVDTLDDFFTGGHWDVPWWEAAVRRELRSDKELCELLSSP